MASFSMGWQLGVGGDDVTGRSSTTWGVSLPPPWGGGVMTCSLPGSTDLLVHGARLQLRAVALGG